MSISNSPDEWIWRGISQTLLRRMRPSCVQVGRAAYRYLIEQSCDFRLTVTGSTLPIFEAYRRDHPEAVPMQRIALDWAGTPSRERYPEITGRALRHMRCLKRAFGVSHYDGVPIEIVEDDRFVHVLEEAWPV